MKKSLFFSLLWICSILLTFIGTTFIYKNENSSSLDKKKFVKNNENKINEKVAEKEKISYVTKLPNFIEKDLKKLGIDTLNLTKEEWIKFKNILGRKKVEKLPLQDNSKYSLLHIASGLSDINLLKYLLKNGYNVNARNEYDETVIMQAIFNGNLETVKFLYDNAASLDDTLDVDGQIFDMMEFALMRPNSTEKTRIISFLEQKGFSLSNEKYIDIINMPENKKQFLDVLNSSNLNSNKKNLFEDVVSQGHDNEVIEHFLNNDVEISANNNANILNAIAMNKNISEQNIQNIINKGANVNKVGKDSFTPLMNAVSNYNFNAVEIFLRNGADVSKKDSLNRTAYDFILPTLKYEEMPTIENQKKMKALLDKYNKKVKN